MTKPKSKSETIAETTPSSEPAKPLAELLPEVTRGRWWRVIYEPDRSNTKPIKVEYRESYTPGVKAVSRLLGYERTISSATAIVEAADLILARHRDYALFVGEYGEFDG